MTNRIREHNPRRGRQQPNEMSRSTIPPLWSSRIRRWGWLLGVIVTVVMTGTRVAESAAIVTDAFTAVTYRGKYVVLNFWATWCGPCREELPEFKRFYDEMKRNTHVTLIGVSLDHHRQTLLDFLKKEKITWPQVYEGQGTRSPSAQRYHVRGIPHTMLLGPTGDVLIARGSLSRIQEELTTRLAGEAQTSPKPAIGGTTRGSATQESAPSEEASTRASEEQHEEESIQQQRQERLDRASGAMGTIKGTVRYNHRTISRLSPSWFSLRARDEHQGLPVELDWSVEDSTYEVKRIPLGAYGIEAVLDANPKNGPGFAGDFTAWVPNVDIHQDGQAVHRDIDLEQLIRLIQPLDNSQRIPRSYRAPYPTHRSPVRFIWEPVPFATQYQCAISTRGEGLTTAQPAVSERTPFTQWRVELPPSAPGQFYLFTIAAFNGADQLAHLEVQGTDFRAWDYRFVVKKSPVGHAVKHSGGSATP